MKTFIIAFLTMLSSTNFLTESNIYDTYMPSVVTVAEDIGEYVESIYSIKIYAKINGSWKETNGKLPNGLIIRRLKNGQYWAHQHGAADWRYMYRVMRSDLQGYRYVVEMPGSRGLLRCYFNPRAF